MTGHKVQIAYIHGDNVTHSFHHSIMRLSNQPNSSTLYTPNVSSARSDALSIPESRNALMKYFLDQTEATHIWWIDTDMGFAPDTVEKLLETGKDVVGALCKGLDKTAPDGFGGYLTKEFITAYDLSTYKVIGEDKSERELIAFTLKEDLDLDSGDLIPVAGTGTACLLISRDAAMRVRNFYGPRWFERVAMPDPNPRAKPHIIGEDLSFCYRLATVGIPIYIHPKVTTTHAKTVWIQ